MGGRWRILREVVLLGSAESVSCVDLRLERVVVVVVVVREQVVRHRDHSHGRPLRGDAAALECSPGNHVVAVMAGPLIVVRGTSLAGGGRIFVDEGRKTQQLRRRPSRVSLDYLRELRSSGQALSMLLAAEAAVFAERVEGTTNLLARWARNTDHSLNPPGGDHFH